ncbi:hypothetical protein ACJIZ3_025159 [Penstemon smallii]|uniref:Uncharacterized protein n=1 Tax=Penstemon smallii TaxID=265156 RepID=A0ABD3TWE9_9LAMI
MYIELIKEFEKHYNIACAAKKFDVAYRSVLCL